MKFDAFVGPAYAARSLAVSAQRALNLYLEADESRGESKGPRSLLGTPGIADYATLPTSPVRGVWTGLADALPGTTARDLSFAVAGSKLYEVYQSGTVSTNGTAVTWASGSRFSATTTNGAIVAGAKMVIGGTTYTVSSVASATSLTLTASAGVQAGVAFYAYLPLGDVGDDATHSPVTFQVNGGQILISSGGLLWVYDGSLARAYFNNGLGTVTTSGVDVLWTSGDPFDASLVGSGIVINGVGYVVDTVTDSKNLTLTASAGSQTGVAFRVMSGSGTAIGVAGTIQYKSGVSFLGLQVGDPIIIAGSAYTITTVFLGAQIGVFDYVTVTPTPFPVLFFDEVEIQISQRVPAAQTAFLDGYAVALAPGSKTFAISRLHDFAIWNPLDYARKEGFPDNLNAILADHEQLWLFGTETTEVWGNSGNADFPFERIGSAFIHQGNRAPFATVRLSNGVAWIGGSERGGSVAWRAEGFQPVRVSTHAIEKAWGDYSTVSDATAFTYVEDGHEFWVISFPTASATWCYDATAGTWHERGWWNGTTDVRQRQAFHGFAFGKHLVGDWENGKIYEQSLSYFSDAGTARHYIRTAPHLTDEERPSFYSRFRLSMQSGPTPDLRWSGDLGVTFSTPVAGSTRRIGTATQDTEWRRLGRDWDRVFRMDILDSSHQVAITGAYIDVSANG